MEISLSLAEGIEPGRFILEERAVFLHKFKNSADLLKIRDISEREVLAAVRNLARNVNNYRLILYGFQGRMPNKGMECSLSSLLTYMDTIWDERRTLGREAVYVADKIVMAYESLADQLREAPI